MALYFISYDIQSGHDYSNLYAALQQLNAKRILLSVWALSRVNTTTSGLRDFLKGHLRNGDRLLVIEASDWAGWNLLFDPNKL